MPALISKARTLGGFRRHLVTDTDGAPCCCGGGATGPCCVVQHRLPVECARDPVELDPNTCCSCGTLFRRTIQCEASYVLVASNNQTTPPFAGSFSLRVLFDYEYTVRCDTINGVGFYSVVRGSANVRTADIVGDFSDNAGEPVHMAYARQTMPPPPWSSWEQYLGIGGSDPEQPGNEQCALGIIHAYGLPQFFFETRFSRRLLLDRIRAERPDVIQFWDTTGNTPFWIPSGPFARPVGLLVMNEGACIIGYEPGVRCDCPRSYNFRFEGGSPPAYFDFLPGGYLRNPQIQWSGTQRCGLATYTASNGGSLYQQDVNGGGFDVYTGAVSAQANAAIWTTVLNQCDPNPCPPAPAPLPLTVADANRLIGAALGELG